MLIRKYYNLNRQFANIAHVWCRFRPCAGPIRVNWALTYRCNSSCAICSRWKAAGGESGVELSTDEARELIGRFSRMGVINLSFTGGEPFMRDDFLKLTQCAGHSGIIAVTATTNGIALDNFIEQVFSSGLSVLSVSLDAADSKTYRRLRGVDAFDRVLGNIAKLVKAKRKHKIKKPLIEINTVVSRINYKQLPAIAESAVDLGVDSFNFGPLNHLPSHGFAADEGMLIKDENEKEELTKIVASLLDRKGLKLREDRRFYGNVASFLFDPEGTKSIPCWATHFTVFINPYGNIYPCYGSRVSLGNIRTADLRTTWFSAEFQREREAVLRGDHRPCWMSCYAPFRYGLSHLVYRGFDYLMRIGGSA